MDTLLSRISESIKKKDYLKAEEFGWQLYKQKKNDFNTIKNLGLILLLQGKFYGSIDLYEKAYQKNENDLDIVTNLAYLYLKIEEFQKSYDFCKKSINMNPEAYMPFVTLLDLNLRKRDFIEAHRLAEMILKKVDYETLVQDSLIIYLVLDAYLAAKKKEEALKLVYYIYKKKFNSDIFYYHSSFSPETISEQVVKAALKEIEINNFNNPVEKGKKLAPVYFGLAKYNEKKKNDFLSDENYLIGNRQIAEIQRFQPLTNQTLIKKIKKIFTNRQSKYPSIDDSGLIFIVGMPRSGTTLIESIIASANNSISGGELRSIHELVKFQYEEDDDILETNDPGKIYLDRIKFIRGKNEFFIDKLPGNYHNLGFIKEIFPKSKIIYIKRDPWDNAISLFKQFYVSNIPYASSFFNLGIMYANHLEIMRFWREELGIDILTIDYENLVQETTQWADTIFKYCEITDTYDETKREGFFARTASKNQVTQGVYTNSINKSYFADKKEEFLNSLENQKKYWNL